MADFSDVQLFEASWEVCNKVGGIHTVIATKLPHALRTFPGHYLPVGPWLGDAQRTVFNEQAIPKEWHGVANSLEKQGVSFHYGVWLIDENPACILLGFDGLVSQNSALKSDFWERYQLDTLGSNFYDIDQPLLWSIAVGKLADTYADLHPQPVLLHAHEWLTGGAVLTVRHEQVRTVFTTHATVLGRALSSQDTFIYNQLSKLNPAAEAARLNVVTKHQIEQLAAKNATVFTTVSEITADEAAAFLGRRPSVTTENGISFEQFPEYDEIAQGRLAMHRQLDDFVAAYFFPHYRFDLEQTSYQYTMGRYEVHNKGYDLYLESLASLNEQLKEAKSTKTVVAMFLVPGDVLRLRPEMATQLAAYRLMRDALRTYSTTLPSQLYANFWSDTYEGTIPATLLARLNQFRSHIPHTDQPALSPYDYRTGTDAMLSIATEFGLLNREEDRVKVVFFPLYIDGFDGIFNLPLYDIISGFDLGVFPSLYEPWGYTPLESVVMGVPAITSTVAGFGQASKEFNSRGVFILDRSHNEPELEHEALTDILQATLESTERVWSNRRMAAYQLAERFAWDSLYERYRAAYNEALE